MSHEQLVALLARSRTILDRYLFEADGEAIRDDVAEICMAIDDALPAAADLQPGDAEPERFERSAA